MTVSVNSFRLMLRLNRLLCKNYILSWGVCNTCGKFVEHVTAVYDGEAEEAFKQFWTGLEADCRQKNRG